MSFLEKEIENSLRTLRNGGTILYPTDTIWGIGCDATNFKAVEKVFRIKQRAEWKSLIILLDDVAKLPNYVEKVPDITYDLLDSVDKPLTIIYNHARNLARNVVAADNSVAIRIASDEFCKTLIKAFDRPIVSTSANVSNEPPALLFSKISPQIRKSVDYVVGLYHDQVNQTKPSTMIRIFDSGDFRIVRQ